MAMSAKKRVILSRLESDYGVALVLGPIANLNVTATDAILCSNLNLKPLEGTVVERNIIRPYFGSAGTSRAESFVSLSFDTELASANNSAMTPQWDNLALSCGFSRQVISAIGSVRSGVVAAGQIANSISVQLDSSSSTTDNTYSGWSIRVGNQNCGTILTYDGSTKIATVSTAVVAAQSAGVTTFDISTNLSQSGGVVSGIVNAAQAAGSTTIVLASTASGTDNYYVGWAVRVGTQLCGTVTSYVGATKTAILSVAVTSAQTSGTTAYDLVNGSIQTGTCQAGGATGTSIVLSTNSSSVDNFYVGCAVRLSGTATSAVITAYNGATKTATVAGLGATTASTGYEISNAFTNTTISGTVSTAQGNYSTTIVLGTPSSGISLSGVDNYYKGYTIRVGSQVAVVTSYVASTKTITVSSGDAISNVQVANVTSYDLTPSSTNSALMQVRLSNTASFVDDYYVGSTITVVTPTNGSVSGAPVVVTESREIVAYNATTRTVTVNTPLTVVPAPSSTYAISAATAYVLNSDVASTQNSSSTFYVNIDGESHQIIGARGTLSLDFTAKQFPMMKWTFTGMLGTISAIPQVIGDFSYWEAPVACNSVNTNQFTLCDSQPSFSKLSIDFGNTVVHRQLIGVENVIISDRKPKGSITIEATNTSLLTSYFTKVKVDTTGLFYVRHGSKAGDYVAIWAPVCQIGSPNYSEQDALVMLDMTLDFQPKLTSALTGGNNELRLICK